MTKIFKKFFTLCFLPIFLFSLFSFPSYGASPIATLTADGLLIGTYPSVQEAVDAVTTTTGSDFLIEIAEGIVDDPLFILQLENKNLTIMPQSGAAVTFTNTITIDGGGELNHPERLLIQGLSFDLTSGIPEECIFFNFLPTRSGHCYPHNVTINGCSFTGIEGTTVAIQSIRGGSKNIAVTNCTGNNLHSFAQLKAVAGYAFLQNCTLTNSLESVNFYGPADLIIDSCYLDAQMYAVRTGQSDGTVTPGSSLTINNSILRSSFPTDGTIILRGGAGENINILHSTITNTDEAGMAFQNLVPANAALFHPTILESDINGTISAIDLSSFIIIDDPAVPNGPVLLGPQPSYLGLVAFLSLLVLILLIILLSGFSFFMILNAIYLLLWIIFPPFRKDPVRCRCRFFCCRKKCCNPKPCPSRKN